MKKLSEMTDEERYGKVGAAIRRLDPEAYKRRTDKSAEANLKLLKELRAKKSPSRTASADDLDMSGGEPKLNLPKLGRVNLEDEGRRPKPGSGYKTPGSRYTGTYGETREAMDESKVTPEQKKTALKIGAGTLAAAIGGPELAALRGASTTERVAAGTRGIEMAEREAARRAEDIAAEKVARGVSRRGMPNYSDRYRAGEAAKEQREAFRRSKALDEQLSSDMAGGYRRGGKVKKYSSGSSVSSASKRADGIAQRGKTRGRYI
jgi:hypothetical protein